VGGEQVSTTVLNTNCSENATNLTREWFAFRVRPRHEKSVTLQLREKKEECFLPLVKESRRWANRLSHVELPVIPGYVFCRAYRFALLPILKTPGVVDVVRAGRNPAPIPAPEIEALERAINASLLVEPCPYFEIGHKIEIRRGPLAGVSGTVIEYRNTKQLILSVSILRRSVLVHVDLAAVTDDRTVLMSSERDQVA
jgi:transcription antitermination factor NusG